MTARYTFVCCVSCGVVSPPLIYAEEAPPRLHHSLINAGWRLDKHRFSFSATCPRCCADERSKARAAAATK